MRGYAHPILRRWSPAWLAGLLAVASAAGPAFAQDAGADGVAPTPSAGSARISDQPTQELPPQVRGLEVQERLGATLPLELQFVDHTGRTVSLSEYFPAASGRRNTGERPRPSIIMVGYYGCPVVCPVVQDKMLESLEQVDLTIGKDFNFLVFSFEPQESVAVARGSRERAMSGYRRSGSVEVDRGFAYHAGNAEATRQLSNALGFPYRKVENGEYSHPVALFVVSPDGVITRYIYGFSFPPAQVKLALLDASDGKLARSIGDYFMNYCYLYDPSLGKYTIHAMRVMQVGGVLAIVVVGGLIAGLRVAERLRRRPAASGGPTSASARAGGEPMTGPAA